MKSFSVTAPAHHSTCYSFICEFLLGLSCSEGKRIDMAGDPDKIDTLDSGLHVVRVGFAANERRRDGNRLASRPFLYTNRRSPYT